VPSGSYDHNNALNLGENRWKVDLQTAWVKYFTEKWALDVVGDAIWYGDNNDYGPTSSRLQQDNSWAAQIMGRYMPAPTLAFGLGFGQTWVVKQPWTETSRITRRRPPTSVSRPRHLSHPAISFKYSLAGICVLKTARKRISG
jgi:hypothetical protein